MLSDLGVVLRLLAAEVSALNKGDDLVKQRLGSLEHRYSEMLMLLKSK